MDYESVAFRFYEKLLSSNVNPSVSTFIQHEEPNISPFKKIKNDPSKTFSSEDPNNNIQISSLTLKKIFNINNSKENIKPKVVSSNIISNPFSEVCDSLIIDKVLFLEWLQQHFLNKPCDKCSKRNLFLKVSKFYKHIC